MDKEILDRLENIEKKLSNKKKGFFEKIQILTPILIPITIAFVGWYFTNQHNENQLKLQEMNSENQRQVAMINATVGQSSLIRDFIPHLNSADTSEQNIALVAILYAAPGPGKEIVEIVAKSGNSNASSKANVALANKRKDLINSLFSFQKHTRLIAANEISSNWTSDNKIINELIVKAKNCLHNNSGIIDCNNGVYNVIIVLQNFPKELLKVHEKEIQALIDLIPESNKLTRNQGNKLLKIIG